MARDTDRLESRWIRVGELTIHVRVSREPAREPGPPLVLVHGLVISSLYMVPTALRLAPHFPVFAPDLPGFGRSDKPGEVLSVRGLADSLLGCLDALRLERAVLIGNSLGCQILVDLAARHPERVAAAVLAGPTMDRHARSELRQIGRWLVDWTREPPSLALAHARDYLEAGVRRAWKTFRFALADPIEDKLSHVLAPTLVVRGERDTIVPQEWAEEVTGLLPDGRLRVIPAGPHVVNYTTPDAFARCVLDFLAARSSSPPAHRSRR